MSSYLHTPLPPYQENNCCYHYCYDLFTNPGTTPITILAINSDHGLSFAGEETRTMVWVSFSLQIYSTYAFWRFKFSVGWVLVWVSPGRKLGPWSEFPFLYRFTVLLHSGGSNSPWSEFWSEFPHFMGMGVVPAPSIWEKLNRGVSKPGGFQTGGFPTFFGKGPDCVADPFGTVPRRCCW